MLHNEGAVAMLYSTIDLINEIYDSPTIYLLVAKNDLSETKELLSKKRINILTFSVPSYGYKRYIIAICVKNISKYVLKKIIDESEFEIYRIADLVIDISGDTLSDHYGKRNSFEELCNFFPALCFSPKLIIFPQSIGPYVHLINKFFAKYVFNKSHLVIPREEITNTILSKLKIKTNLPFVINDVAFWLKPTDKVMLNRIINEEKIDIRMPLVGISVSQSFIHFRADKSLNLDDLYFNRMLEVIEFAVGHLHANVVLIPHVTGPTKERHDDRIACQKLYAMSKHKNRLIMLRDKYKADELKAVISLCVLFVGARMHANIAALSSGVPTLAISYSHKTEGILSLLNMVKWVYKDFSVSIESVLQEIIDQKDEIKKTLRNKMMEFEDNREKLKKILLNI